MTTPELAARLDAKATGDGWEARCPAHEDHRASLSINSGENGRVLLHCHRGCATDAVLSALNLKPGDLFPVKTTSKPRIVATYE